MLYSEYIENYNNLDKCQHYTRRIEDKAELVAYTTGKTAFPIEKIEKDKYGWTIHWRTQTSYEFDKYYGFEPPKEVEWAWKEWRERQLKLKGKAVTDKADVRKNFMIQLG